MRGRVLFLGVFVFQLCAWASEPGQPLDCSDWVFLKPGLSCASVIPPDIQGGPSGDIRTSGWWNNGSSLATDNEGNRLLVRSRLMNNCPDSTRVEIVSLRDGAEAVLAYAESRCNPGGSEDVIRTTTGGTVPGPEGQYAVVGNVLAFDPISGSLYVPLSSRGFCSGCNPSPQYPFNPLNWIARLSGFAPLFEILQTYTPPASALSFAVPAMPEGMRAADHFDTYWGDLTPRVDFTQARALQCGFPATPPNAGDYLTVPDPLPNPDAGHGRWYLTAATYQGETRSGRKSLRGHLSGRDSSLLPACVQP